MKPTNTVAKLFSSVSTLAVVAGAMALNGLAWGQAGQVVTWGNLIGNVPTNLGPCRAITAGRSIVVVIKENGTVAAWGDSQEGNLNVPSDLGTCKAIAAGGYHVVAIQENGNVRSWGRYIGNPPINLGVCKAIAAINNRTMAIKEDGTVVGWGEAHYGENNPPSNLGACIAISLGYIHSIALKENGSIIGWGNNIVGQLNIPTDLGICKAIASGDTHGMALKADGEVIVWGQNQYGQCNVPSNLGNCKAIAAYSNHSIALKENGTVIAWGQNGAGQCDVPQTLFQCNQIAAGDSHSVAIQIPVTITGVLPISGPSIGNTNITITGTNFFNPSTVTIGGAPATNVVVVSDTQITATTPAGFPGPAVVTVNSGSSTAFYYRPSCGSDVDNNGVVDSGDLSIVLLDFGSCSESAAVAPQQEPLILQVPEPAKSVPNKK